MELDGTESEVNILIKRVEEIAKKNKSTYLRISKNDEERLRFWLGRKAAFPAIGDMSPDYLCMDGTIPRKKLAEVLTRPSGCGQRGASAGSFAATSLLRIGLTKNEPADQVS